MMQRSSSGGRPCDAGYFLIIVGISIFVILSAIGLFIDGGNLTNAQSNLQQSIDAASIKVASLIDDQPSAGLTATARKLVEDNLKQRGIAVPIARLDITLDPPVDPRSIVIEAELVTPLYLMHIARAFGQNYHVVKASANAIAVRKYVSLLLDTSGSMCALDGPWGLNNNPVGCPKVNGLETGVIAFIDLFVEDDYLSIVRFSNRQNDTDAVVEEPMAQMTVSNRAAFINNITSIPPPANPPTRGILRPDRFTRTNGEMAMRLGIDQIVNANPGPGDITQIIYFSDGAPHSAGNGNVPGCNYAPFGYVQTRMGRYVNTLLQADRARTLGITVYGIGLGAPASLHQQDDPFQGGPTLETEIHDYFLARLANDQAFMDQLWTDPSDPNNLYVQPDFPCVPSNTAIVGEIQGRFYETPDPAQIQDILNEIGTSVRVRLLR